jgi:hypothetical protein
MLVGNQQWVGSNQKIKNLVWELTCRKQIQSPCAAKQKSPKLRTIPGNTSGNSGGGDSELKWAEVLDFNKHPLNVYAAASFRQTAVWSHVSCMYAM